MSKVFADSEEKYLKAVVLYADEDSKLTYTEDGEDYVTAKDLMNLFVKSLVRISTSDGVLIPTKAVAADTSTLYATVSVLDAVTESTATVPAWVSFYSEEYSAD